MLQLLDMTNAAHHAISLQKSQERKVEFAQFMTPPSVAYFMAGMFPSSAIKNAHLLDAGAGTGSLSCAFIDRWRSGDFGFESVRVTAYEIDSMLHEKLKRRLSEYSGVTTEIVLGDYIHLATTHHSQSNLYTHVILNPPYKRINQKSGYRQTLREIGIDAVNLYSAFVALAVTQTLPGGQLVAIIPRSFCNGPYYRPFRNFILDHTAIRHIHLFKSRSKVFKDDSVLQENMIIRLERGGRQGPVTITTSTDHTFSDLVSHEHHIDNIIVPNDTERFIHVPTSMNESIIEQSDAIRYTLTDLGISVSTGPVVDFRLKEHLYRLPEENTVPLIYPKHLSEKGVTWPLSDFKKPNAILRNPVTQKWLYPNGFYCVVRRFSAKEEKRRISACVTSPSDFPNYATLGFENHLNLFHENKHGLPEFLARGLAIFLNTTAVDEIVRRFNGHTQINATDLRKIKYPSREILIELGQWAKKHRMITQHMMDEQVRNLTV